MEVVDRHPVVVVIQTESDVLDAVRAVAAGRSIALLLPEQACGAKVPARPLRKGAREQAQRLVDSRGAALLDGSTGLFGVGRWPDAVWPSPRI